MILFAALFLAGAWASLSDQTLDFVPGPGEAIFLSPEATARATESITWGIQYAGVNPRTENASLPMVPASVMKTITAAAALDYLGADAGFENRFDAHFDPRSSVASDIRFSVSGDPTWGLAGFETLNQRMNLVIAELKAKKIKVVTGPIEVVSTRPGLATLQRQTGWPDRWLLQCMATFSTPFMYNGNCGSLSILSRTSARWQTAGVDIPVILKLVSGNSNQFQITPALDPFGKIISYTISGKFKSAVSGYALPVHQGTSWLQNLFVKALAANAITYKPTDLRTSTETLSVDLSSKRLIEILTWAVQNSINSVLDRIFYELPEGASFATLQKFVNNASLLPGTQIFDGSGLVVDDRLRADTMFSFFKNLENAPFFNDYFSVLAVAGVSGTLANRLTGPLTRGKISAKTGTIDGFYNLAGYYRKIDQSLEPFVIFTDSNVAAATVRTLIDKIVTEFAGSN